MSARAAPWPRTRLCFKGLALLPSFVASTALVFEVRPAKVLAFAKGRFGQTRYRFS